jgi:16S rRNA A1518/A1519 N6-dimethyltransferase RsmA/KsgA/DIM1 with predicted DNA glycosylase/AP lyase activity
MQTQTQIRQLLTGAGLAPNKALGQNFLIDLNLLGKIVELAQVGSGDVVLEVGPGTGSLTEELAQRARRVVAVEIDRGLSELLRQRLAGRENVLILHADVLAGKHEISPAVVAELAPRASLVSNLPYNVATPLVAECLLQSHRAARRVAGTLPARAAAILAAEAGEEPAREENAGAAEAAEGAATAEEAEGKMPSQRADKMSATRAGETPATLFDRLTFTVQREVADRLAAGSGTEAYGPLSVIVAILGKVTPGPVIPASAFWPRPSVASRVLRIDFDAASALRLHDAATLTSLLGLAFGQRRKQIGSLLHRNDCPFDAIALAGAFEQAGVDKKLRPEQVSAEQYLATANALHGSTRERAK